VRVRQAHSLEKLTMRDTKALRELPPEDRAPTCSPSSMSADGLVALLPEIGELASLTRLAHTATR
jgi:hypothetical protein